MNFTYPKLDIFQKYNQTHLPRPQPSDVAVNLLNHDNNGFFVDIGANDGISCSNSLVLEEGYNWKGICVEPHPLTFKKLLKNRPLSKCFNIGLANENANLEFWAIDGEGQSISGFDKYFSNIHKNRLLNDVTKNNDKLEKITVQVKRTSDFFNELNTKKIDYLSIDAEGSDFEIIKGIDFNSVQIKLISIEADQCFEEVKEHLKLKNFEYIVKCCSDHFFLNKKIF